jgi:hypothetical protein
MRMNTPKTLNRMPAMIVPIAVSITDATSATTATAASSRMKMAATARPGPSALGASDPSRPHQ